MVGTDLTYNIHDYILRDLEDSHEPSPLLSQLPRCGQDRLQDRRGLPEVDA